MSHETFFGVEEKKKRDLEWRRETRPQMQPQKEKHIEGCDKRVKENTRQQPGEFHFTTVHYTCVLLPTHMCAREGISDLTVISLSLISTTVTITTESHSPKGTSDKPPHEPHENVTECQVQTLI